MFSITNGHATATTLVNYPTAIHPTPSKPNNSHKPAASENKWWTKMWYICKTNSLLPQNIPPTSNQPTNELQFVHNLDRQWTGQCPDDEQTNGKANRTSRKTATNQVERKNIGRNFSLLWIIITFAADEQEQETVESKLLVVYTTILPCSSVERKLIVTLSFSCFRKQFYNFTNNKVMNNNEFGLHLEYWPLFNIQIQSSERMRDEFSWTLHTHFHLTSHTHLTILRNILNSDTFHFLSSLWIMHLELSFYSRIEDVRNRHFG